MPDNKPQNPVAETNRSRKRKTYFRYNLSLDDAENRTLQQRYALYQEKGGEKKITTFLKELCLTTEVPNDNLRKSEIKNVKDAIYELNKVGVNLNQMVKEIKQHNFDNVLSGDCQENLKLLKVVLIKFQKLQVLNH